MNYPVVIGGSAGSFRIITKIVPVLNKGFDFPLILCMHRQRKNSENFLLALRGNNNAPVLEPESGDAPLPGKIYVAPSNKHLIIQSGRFQLTDDPAVNFSRPSIDVTMSSLAGEYGKKLVGVLLTGANNDGAEGLETIHKAGGITIVQDPADAEVSVMPLAAVNSFRPEHILPAEKIITFIEKLTTPEHA